MSISASQIFDFLERHEAWSLDRYEIASPAFGALRRSLRQIILRFRDSDDQLALDILDGLRPLLSEWLTTPMPFDQSVRDAMTDLFGEPELVQARWGPDIRASYEAALRAADDLRSIESPMRQRLRTLIQELSSQARALKIYCHRRARPHFESLFAPADGTSIIRLNYLHSLPEYREAEPFDTLIKVGPLRVRGWGSAPDALVTAPRFGTLAQLVWSGSIDDADFGYSPVSPPRESEVNKGATFAAASGGYASLKWMTHTTQFGEDPDSTSRTDADVDIDELRSLQNVFQYRDKRSASLVQIDDRHGILYPPHSQVLCFDPDPAVKNPIERRIPGETLHERMFLIRPNLADVDLGSVSARHGSHSQIWKNRLTQEFRSNADDLVRRLRTAGLNLVHLRSAIEHWCEPPTSVVHAPQQMRHFEILIQVLRLNDQAESIRARTSSSWWQQAWIEIRRSRGEAIQSGFVEKEIVDEQLLIILQGMLPQIRDMAAKGASFQVAIPLRSDVRGSLMFCPVIAIEHGFHVPETELKIIHELKATDKWRD